MEGPGWSRRAPLRPPWSVDDVVAMESLLARVRDAERDSPYRIRAFNPDNFCSVWCFDMHTCQKIDCWFAHSELEFEYFSARRDAALSGDTPLAQQVERFFDGDIDFLVDHELKTSCIWGHRGRGHEYSMFVRPSSHAPEPACNPEALSSPRGPSPNPSSSHALYPRSHLDNDTAPSPTICELSGGGPEKQGELGERPAKRTRTRDGGDAGPARDFDAALGRVRDNAISPSLRERESSDAGPERQGELGQRPAKRTRTRTRDGEYARPVSDFDATLGRVRASDISPSLRKRESSDAEPERQGELGQRPAKRTRTRTRTRTSDSEYAGPVSDFDAALGRLRDADVRVDRDAIRAFLKAESGVFGKGESMLECVLCSSSPMSLEEMQEHVKDVKHTRAKAAFSESVKKGKRHTRSRVEFFASGMRGRGGSTKAMRCRLNRSSSEPVRAEELASFGPFVFGKDPFAQRVICEVCPKCGPLTLGSLVSHADGKMHRKNVARQEKSHPLETRRTRPLERQREEQAVAAPEQPAEQPAEQLAEQPAEDWLDQPMCMENWKEMEKMFLGRGGVEALSFKVVRDIMLSPTNGIEEADMETLARVQKRAAMVLQPSDQPGRRSQWVPGPAVEGCSPEEQEALARLEDSINVTIDPFHVPEKSEEIETEAYRVDENEECRAQDPRGFGKLGKLSGQTQAFRLEVDRGGNEHVRMAQLAQSVFHEKSVMRDEVFLRYCVPPGVRAAIEAQDVAKQGRVGNVATFD